jgi:ubiquitin-like 1-activating enzyme E1 A
MFTWYGKLQSFNESQIPTALIERLLSSGKKEHPPVCAILGGILGQVCSSALF